MTAKRKKKVKKLRGSRTHGHGAGKKHRGKGHKGGHGFAGKGKRGAQKKTYYLAKGIQPLGKRGAVKIRARLKKIRAINLGELSQKLPKWIAEGKASEKEVNLTSLGYDKLLGRGMLTRKINIIVKQASKKAVEKLEKIGIKLEGVKSG